MSTVFDYFGNLGRRAKEVGEAGAQRMKDAVNGLRGQPSADEAAVRSAQNAEAAGLERGPSGLRSKVTSEAARAANPSGAAEPMGLGERLSQARKFADNLGAPNQRLAGALVKTARFAGPAMEVYDAGSNIAAGENPVRSIGRSLLRGGATTLGAVGGGTLGAFGGPVGAVAGSVAGGSAGYQLGDYVANKVFGPEPGAPGAQVAQAAPAAAAAPAPQQPAPTIASAPVSAPVDSNYVDLVGGDKARPAVLTDSTVGVPVSGQGALRRTTPGNQGDAIKLGGSTGGSAAASAAPAPAAPAADFQANVRKLGLRGAMKVREDETTRRGQDVASESNAMARAVQIATLQHTIGKENAATHDKAIEDYARGKVAVPGTISNMVDKQKYENDVKAKASALKADINYSVADRKDGTTMEKLTPTQRNQLFLANDLKERITDARGGIVQSMRDFFGNKRFDSRNLYSYMPVSAEPSMQGGYVVHFANGNTAHVVDVAGGGLNIFGPNTPVDADVAAILKPVIDRAKRQGK